MFFSNIILHSPSNTLEHLSQLRSQRKCACGDNCYPRDQLGNPCAKHLWYQENR